MYAQAAVSQRRLVPANYPCELPGLLLDPAGDSLSGQCLALPPVHVPLAGPAGNAEGPRHVHGCCGAVIRSVAAHRNDDANGADAIDADDDEGDEGDDERMMRADSGGQSPALSLTLTLTLPGPGWSRDVQVVARKTVAARLVASGAGSGATIGLVVHVSGAGIWTALGPCGCQIRDDDDDDDDDDDSDD
jgi:hypothetical protein